MLKNTLYTLALLTMLLAGAFFMASSSLEQGFRESLNRAPASSARYGVRLFAPTFEDMRMSSFQHVMWRQVRTGFSVSNDEHDNSMYNVTMAVVSLDAANMWKPTMRGEVFGATIVFARTARSDLAGPGWRSDERRRSGMDVRLLHVDFPVDRSNPRASTLQLLNDLSSAVSSLKSPVALELSGQLFFPANGGVEHIALRSEQAGEGSAIIVDPADLDRIANIGKDPLTPAARALLGRYPLRASVILDMKDYADQSAAAVSQRETSVNEEVYRHVVFSYLLTVWFGQDFAAEVADAQQKGLSRPEPERRMLVSNDQIGRRYAQDGVQERDIVDRVMHDPAIIRKVTVNKWSVK